MLFVFLLCWSIEHVQWYMSQLEFIGAIGWGSIYSWIILLYTIHVGNPSMVQCRTKLMGFHTQVLGFSSKQDCYWQVFLIWLHIQQLGLCLCVCGGGVGANNYVLAHVHIGLVVGPPIGARLTSSSFVASNRYPLTWSWFVTLRCLWLTFHSNIS